MRQNRLDRRLRRRTLWIRFPWLRTMGKTTLLLATSLALLLGATGMAIAERFVIVNGQRLNQTQISYLEQLHCGPIPNGRFWLDWNTGIWGYSGDPTPQGRIQDNCYVPERRPSLSERGMLFGPQDWVR